MQPFWVLQFLLLFVLFLGLHNSVVKVTLRSFFSGTVTCHGDNGFSAFRSAEVITVVLALAVDDTLRVTCLVPVNEVSW